MSVTKCDRCGFRRGDRVQMRSAIVHESGAPIGIVHGTVATWGECHLVEWDDSGVVTGLPNPNVMLDAGVA